MPREKKPIVVEQYHDKGRDITVDIGYNPNPGKNYHEATIRGETFTNTDLTAVRQWVIQRIADLYSVTWQGVIEVKFEPAHGRGTNLHYPNKIGLAFDRYWVGRLGSGKLRKARWGTEAERPMHWEAERTGDDTPKDKRIEHSEDFRRYGDAAKVEFAPPMMERERYGSTYNTYYYPYSDELWEGLGKVSAEIDRISESLKALLSVDGDAYLAIAAAGASALLSAEVG
jgi:hypothetical protein